MEVRTRMAPSPTGKLHLGTAYATLWPYLFARKNKGVFILRIEDTDRERSTKEFAEDIVRNLKWLGFEWDEGPYYQMDKLSLYQQKAQQLLNGDKAYYCFCSKEELDEERKKQAAEGKPQVYSGKCRKLSAEQAKIRKDKGEAYVVRHKLSENRGVIEFDDLIHGKISFDPKLLGDMVIVRQNGIPLYNFVVVVDDIDTNITHVLRGEDHISNTPKQILFFEALGAVPPKFGHYPVILNQDRLGKLSKRTGSTAVEEYKKEGYLPEALINYLALIGWTPPNGKEILRKEEIIDSFDIKDMNKAAAAWNQAKLDWINGEYIRMLPDEELTARLQEFLVDHPAREKIDPVVPLVKERIKKLSDFIPLTDFLFEKPEYEKDIFLLQLKGKENEAGNILSEVEKTLSSLKTPWEAEEFERVFRDLAEKLNLSSTQMFQLIRIAVSGQTVTPPLFESIKILGEEETLKRVEDSVAIFKPE